MGAILGLGAGFVLAIHTFHGGWPTLSPRTALDRIGVLVIPLGLVAAAISGTKFPRMIRALLAIIAPALLVWLLFKPLPPSSLPPAQLWNWAGIAGILAAVAIAATERVASKSGGIAASLILGPLCAGVGILIALNGDQTLGMPAAAMAFIVLAWLLLSFVDSKFSLSQGPAWVCLTLVAGLLAYGYFESDSMTRPQLALICIGPLLALLVELRPLRPRKPWLRELLRLALVLIPIATALTLAYIQFKKDQANNSGLDM